MQITTARKALTLLLSYLIFTKPMTDQHGTGLLLIALGVVLKMVPEKKISAVQNAVARHAKSTFSVVEEQSRDCKVGK